MPTSMSAREKRIEDLFGIIAKSVKEIATLKLEMTQSFVAVKKIKAKNAVKQLIKKSSK